MALREVRTPVGVVDLCNICKALVPYVGCCVECAGLRLDLPAAAAGNVSASDGEEIGGLVGEEVTAMPRMRQSTRTARGGQGRSFYSDLSGSGDTGAQRIPNS